MRTAKLKLELDVVCFADYDVAAELASEMLNNLLAEVNDLESEYGYILIDNATVLDGEEVL